MGEWQPIDTLGTIPHGWFVVMRADIGLILTHPGREPVQVPPGVRFVERVRQALRTLPAPPEASDAG